MSRTTLRRTGRVAAALLPVLALVTVGTAAAVPTDRAHAPAAASPASAGRAAAGAAGGGGDGYINYVAPQAEPQISPDTKPSDLTRRAARRTQARAAAIDRKFAGGNPVAARQLAKTEARAVATNKNPAAFKKRAATPQTAKLLTLLVEFNPAANDDFTDLQVPATVFGDRTCVPGTIQNGPVHNQILNPATFPAKDNNTFWVPDFSTAHFNKMLYSRRGITDRVRTDLPGPDGRPGIDISGYTMRNHYLEMSKRKYTVDGAAVGWLKVPHSEAWYGASPCLPADEDFPQSMQGHPDNPLGATQLSIDAVTALAAAQPDFPWSDYDQEDQGDVDGDQNLTEPDGIIDHLVLVHAGKDKSGGGGAQGPYAIWAHSSALATPFTVPGTRVKIQNYIVQPEDSGVGVFSHEYGHDLGLPDLYDTSGAGASDIDFWDLMSSGSHTGPIFQSMPTHMGIWDKWVLGWANPKVFKPGDQARTVRLGQTSRTPAGTRDGMIVNLPSKKATIGRPHSGSNMWWSNNDQAWADNTLTRTVSVPTGATDARLWMWNDYIIEELWDYGFVEASTNGTDWTELVVTDADGNVVTTSEDPNGNLAAFGGKKNGLTGSSDGWRHDYVDLSAYAGEDVQVRLHYATDAAFQERGWLADDFSLTNGDTTVWSDDLETGADGWTAQTGSWTNDPLGGGWILTDGTLNRRQFYLAEWRNFDGFDNGLRYAYDTTYQLNGPWKVEKIRYNAPGMLVWYRDRTYGTDNHVTATTADLPSLGSKGGLLLVDSHFNPLHRRGVAAEKDPSMLDDLPSRPQSSNVAFGHHATYPFRECLGEVEGEPVFRSYCNSYGRRAPVSTFDDWRGYYPGLEYRPDLDAADPLFLRDVDASAVVPSRANRLYSTRVVDKRGRLLPSRFGIALGGGHYTGTGNPGTEGAQFGVRVTVAPPTRPSHNTWARVQVRPPRAAR